MPSIQVRIFKGTTNIDTVLNLIITGLLPILSKWYMTGGEQLKF